jgi:hypothetical protein
LRVKRPALSGPVAFALLLLCLSGCATLPHDAAQRALYIDLRTAVDSTETEGWNVDWVRLQSIADPALRSTCQVAPSARDGLEQWLNQQIARAGGSAEQIYHAHGNHMSGAAEEALSLERTRLLLQFAKAHATQDCPFYLAPHADFVGVQGDAGRWLLLAETNAFATFVIDTQVPAIGGGGRLLLGHGIGSRYTLAAGGELAAAGTLLPTSKGSIDGIASVAVPVMLRLAQFSTLYDVELAPVMRFQHGSKAFPPGARIELSAGFSSLRSKAFMSYFMFYGGYEFHPRVSGMPADHTVQLGTRIAVDLGL